MTNFRRIGKISESNINCFSTSPKNEFVYLFDLHAAYFFLGGTACPIVANYFWPAGRSDFLARTLTSES
jgi:hypothetical protein